MTSSFSQTVAIGGRTQENLFGDVRVFFVSVVQHSPVFEHAAEKHLGKPGSRNFSIPSHFHSFGEPLSCATKFIPYGASNDSKRIPKSADDARYPSVALPFPISRIKRPSKTHSPAGALITDNPGLPP